MRLTIERSALLKALNHVQSVVERRNTIPILSNVLIAAQGDSLKLTATDLDIEISEQAPATVERAGQTTAPANYLYDFIRKLPDSAAIKLDVADDARLFISAGKSRLHLPILPAGDFPSMPSDGFETRFEIEPTELARLIDKTRFAISTEETRYYLNGIYLHTAAGEGGASLRAVATDGHRLAQLDLPLPSGAAEERSHCNRTASASAVRWHDEPPDRVPTLLHVRASQLRSGALQFPRCRPQPGYVRSRTG